MTIHHVHKESTWRREWNHRDEEDNEVTLKWFHSAPRVLKYAENRPKRPRPPFFPHP